MELSAEQLALILARALPEARIRETRALPGGRYVLALADGTRLQMQLYASTAAAGAAAAALRQLRGEVDLPIPELRASDPEGATVGLPYLLLGNTPGEPLDQVLPQLDNDALYTVGRRLGTIVSRVHRLACTRYGPLDEGGAAATEREYVLARVECDAQRCGELGLLDRRTGSELTSWFTQHFQPVGKQAALVHGGLTPGCILVRRGESDSASGRGAWRVGGILGWEYALGWCPAWEHATWLDAIDDPRYFSLRVGYGNGYDEQSNRAYEQVREHVLVPYRILLMLQRMQAAYATGDLNECGRRRGILRGLMRVLEG